MEKRESYNPTPGIAILLIAFALLRWSCAGGPEKLSQYMSGEIERSERIADTLSQINTGSFAIHDPDISNEQRDFISEIYTDLQHSIEQTRGSFMLPIDNNFYTFTIIYAQDETTRIQISDDNDIRIIISPSSLQRGYERGSNRDIWMMQDALAKRAFQEIPKALQDALQKT